MPELRPYQRAAVRFLEQVPRAGLFLDMGLGKTAIVLRSLRPEDLPALVVAPKRVAEEVWSPETRLWRPDLRPAVIAGSRAARLAALRICKDDLHILGRDNLNDVLPYVHDRYRTIVLDELSGFKNRSTVRWKVAKKLISGRGVSRVVGMTGTPSPNGLLDLWPQITLLDRGERLGQTLTEFRGRYFRPGKRLPTGVIIEWIPLPGAEETIHRALDDICLGMSSGEYLTDLPPVTHNEVAVTLPPSARAVYKQMKRDLLADLAILGGEVHTASSAAVLSAKLAQISAGFIYHDDADIRGGTFDNVHREKVSALREIVDGTGSPILVFYRFRWEKDTILKEFPQAVSIDQPGSISRWNAGEIPILVAHPASAGHGLNLQHGGHTIVWMSLPWSLEEWQQANKRLARPGQKNPVVIHRIIAERTVDGAIHRALSTKDAVQTALLEHLESAL